jgi:hypothetical protein
LPVSMRSAHSPQGRDPSDRSRWQRRKLNSPFSIGCSYSRSGGHDTSDEVLAWTATRFEDRFRRVKVGEPIVVQAP